MWDDETFELTASVSFETRAAFCSPVSTLHKCTYPLPTKSIWTQRYFSTMMYGTTSRVTPTSVKVKTVCTIAGDYFGAMSLSR
eukprot:6134756-Pleurochrysis_carterae.AAC.1